VSGGLPAVLAIDGGNSKTDVVLVAADGTVRGRAQGPGVPRKLSAQTIALLAPVVRAAAAEAGLAGAGADGAQGADGAKGPAVAMHTAACMANADLPEEEELLGKMLGAQGWSASTQVANDTFAVLAAGLTDPASSWGVAVTCGAGINCVGVAPDGRTMRFLALGGISGDWGGGLGLGREVLWWAVRAEDGRGPQTSLRDALIGHFGVTKAADVTIGIHRGTIAEDSLHELTPALFAAAGAGDRVARELVGRQADEVCSMTLAATRRLGLTGLATPVVLGGSLLTARDCLLAGWVTERLAAAAPAAAVRVVDIPPIAGAALIGLDYTGAGAAARQRLRAGYLIPGRAASPAVLPGPVRPGGWSAAGS
jgi:N-acetylglucosamine kinase-like BadF-type ATPase